MFDPMSDADNQSDQMFDPMSDADNQSDQMSEAESNKIYVSSKIYVLV